MRCISLVFAASLAALTVAMPAAAGEATSDKATSAAIEENNREFLGKGSLIFGTERVFGYSVSSEKAEGADAVKHTQFGLLWAAPTSVYQIPRMAIDYVAFDQVTFGGALGIAHTSIDGGPSATNLLIAPRAGYIFGGRGVLSFWARAGFSFWSVNDSGSRWGTAFNLEPEIILSPYKHLGIYVGAVMDLGMFGHANINDQGGSYNITNFGATGGLRAWF